MNAKKMFQSHFQAMRDAHSEAMDAYDQNSVAHSFHKKGMAACAASLEVCSKAAGMDDDLNKLMPLPEGLSVLTPTPPGIRMVPRAGQQPIPECNDLRHSGRRLGADDPIGLGQAQRVREGPHQASVDEVPSR